MEYLTKMYYFEPIVGICPVRFLLFCSIFLFERTPDWANNAPVSRTRPQLSTQLSWPLGSTFQPPSMDSKALPLSHPVRHLKKDDLFFPTYFYCGTREGGRTQGVPFYSPGLDTEGQGTL